VAILIFCIAESLRSVTGQQAREDPAKRFGLQRTWMMSSDTWSGCVASSRANSRPQDGNDGL